MTSLQPQKAQLWAPCPGHIAQHPVLHRMQAQMKDPRDPSLSWLWPEWILVRENQGGHLVTSDALLTCCAWPLSPPPAQPDMVPKPIEDDLGAVGAVQAYPYTNVVEEVIKQVKPSDLVQVLPLSAFFWKIVLPPQTKVDAYEPVDLRSSRWELYQHIRQVPVMTMGIVQKTLILPCHITLHHAKMRIDERAPPHKHWLLTAASPQDWVLHQIMLPDSVREELHEVDLLREQARQRGGMITGKVPLRVYLVHMEEVQQWKVDTDMDVAYLINASAEECETEVTNVLLMSDTHIPGLQEVIASYLPEVQVYILDCIDESCITASYVLHMRHKRSIQWTYVRGPQ